MCDASEFVKPENRKSLVVVAQDATPVYLDASTGKILIKAETLDELRHRRLAKKAVQSGRAECVVELTGVGEAD